MKKILLSLCTLAAVLSIAFTGCGDSNERQELDAWLTKKGCEYQRQEQDIQDQVDWFKQKLESKSGEDSWREISR